MFDRLQARSDSKNVGAITVFYSEPFARMQEVLKVPEELKSLSNETIQDHLMRVQNTLTYLLNWLSGDSPFHTRKKARF